jgi:hypothetical protein
LILAADPLQLNKEITAMKSNTAAGFISAFLEVSELLLVE